MNKHATIFEPKRVPLLLWGVPVLFLLAAAFLSSRIYLSRERAAAENEIIRSTGNQSLLYGISLHPAFTFGFQNLFADISWLGAVQVAGTRRLTRNEYDRLALMIQTVIHFDPRFKVPYLMGGLLLGDSRPHVQEALKILEQGKANHPDDWRFPFYVGYLYYFAMGDPMEGGRALESAARIEKSPTYLALLAARMFSEGRKPETALRFLNGMIKQEHDPARLEVLRRRIREVVAERDMQWLESAVEAYREKTGRLPKELSDLVREGMISRIPDEPHGGRYLLSPDGKISSSRVRERLKVFRKHAG
ncbi:MAG: tetratricopeptide repeat protein [Candidatus Deferrimicrobiaceae bacterium]